MVAQQKLKETGGPDLEMHNGGGSLSAKAMNGTENGSPKSRLAILKRSSTKAKANSSAKNDPFLFQGAGLDFKGKFIGQRDVAEPRGDVMCAEAMRIVKAGVKASGAHKQRIILNISIDGIKLKDEKSGTTIEAFPVSKISFVARDITDARAFGFVFGTIEGTNRFYGIKTAQTADHAVLTIRDMFQVVFEMKRKQLQEAKQKQEEQENMDNFEREIHGQAPREGDEACPVADLLDLETELENIEQGFHQLQNIPRMPDDEPFQTNGLQWPGDSFNSSMTSGVSGGAADPFGDSFNPIPAAPGSTFLSSQNGSLTNGQLAQSGWQTVNNGTSAPSSLHTSSIGQQFSGTNPFAMHAQQEQSTVYGNGFHTNGFATSPAIKDPFDTQPAHRIINAIDNTHSFGLSASAAPPPHTTRLPPPLPVTAPVVSPIPPLPTPQLAPKVADNCDPYTNGVGNGNGTHTHGVPLSNGTDPHHASIDVFGDTPFAVQGSEANSKQPVSTLEEAFTKLIDMEQLMGQKHSLENGTRKNPFEHIINPPKMSLNALNTSPNSFDFETNNGFHNGATVVPHATNGAIRNGCKAALVLGQPDQRVDPFNDDFFNKQM